MTSLRFLAMLALACTVVSAAPRPTVAADAAAGRAKAAMCSSCHGRDGIASMPDAPNLAGDSAIYTAEQLRAYRSGARQHPQMTVVASSLSDEDIENLAAWFESIEVTATLPPQ